MSSLWVAFEASKTRISLQISSIVTNLTLSWWRPLSHRNQSIDLVRKSMDWFLYDNGLRHERGKGKAIRIVPCFLDFENGKNWWEKFSIALRTRSSHKSDDIGRSILRVSTIFSKWSLNILTTSFSSVTTLSPLMRVILSSLRVLSVQFRLIFSTVG